MTSNRFDRRPPLAMPAIVCVAALLLLAIYLAGFGLLVLDELVLGSFWFQTMPSEIKRSAETIYWPLIELVKCFL